MRSAFRPSLFIPLVALCASCAHVAPPPPKAPPIDDAKGESFTHHLGSFHVASVGEYAIGPFLAVGGDSGLVAYIANGRDSGHRDLVTVPVARYGAPSRDPKTSLELSGDTTTLVFRAGANTVGPRRFFAGWVTLTDRGSSLNWTALGPDGVPFAEPVRIADTRGHIIWTDLVPTPEGGVIAWAEDRGGGATDVLIAAIGNDGTVTSLPMQLASHAVAWQLVPSGSGIGLALAHSKRRAANGPTKEGAMLTWYKLDSLGHPAAAPATVGQLPPDTLAFDAASSPHGTYFAWTDHTSPEPHVAITYLGAEGHVDARRTLRDPSRGGALIRMVEGTSGPVIAWHEFDRAAIQRVHIETLGGGAQMHTTHERILELASLASFELGVTGNGIAVIAKMPVCPSGNDCGNSPVETTYLRFDSNLTKEQRTGLRVGDQIESPALAWSLGCMNTDCLALAAASGRPTPIHTLNLYANSMSPVVQPRLAQKIEPHIGTIETLATMRPVIEVASTTVHMPAPIAAAPAPHGEAAAKAAPAAHAKHAAHSVTLLALLSKPEGELVGARKRGRDTASLSVLALGDHASGATPQPIADDVSPFGGVAIAAGGAPSDGAAVAWAAVEEGEASIYVARVDGAGRRASKLRLAKFRATPGRVAITWSAGRSGKSEHVPGWIVAWIESEGTVGSVRATKVSVDLQRLAPISRVTSAEADASEVSVLGRSDGAWVAWSDARGEGTNGVADIFVSRIGNDCARVLPERRVVATAAHSRSPVLARWGGGVAVGWIEDHGHEGHSEGGVYGAYMIGIAPSGEPTGHVTKIAGGTEATVGGLTLSGHASGDHSRGDLLRGLVVSEAVDPDAPQTGRHPRKRLVLEASEISDGKLKVNRFVSLQLGAVDVPMTVAGDDIYFFDAGPRADYRLRRARFTANK